MLRWSAASTAACMARHGTQTAGGKSGSVRIIEFDPLAVPTLDVIPETRERQRV
jgi:hypothetical protein